MGMRIKSIRPSIEVELTVDIEVADTHSYQLENGVVSHNTVAELVDSSSGIHPRYAHYYIRRVRNDIKDPLSKLMIDQGVPYEIDVTKESNVVFSFPKKAPGNSVTRNDMTAIQQLKHYKIVRDNWTEHNPSITVYVRDDEWLAVGAWVYENWNDVGGISFLPHTDHIYRQAPFEECTKEEYDAAVKAMPEIDFSQLHKYEVEDATSSSHELACSAGGTCAIA